MINYPVYYSRSPPEIIVWFFFRHRLRLIVFALWRFSLPAEPSVTHPGLVTAATKGENLPVVSSEPRTCISSRKGCGENSPHLKTHTIILTRLTAKADEKRL